VKPKSAKAKDYNAGSGYGSFEKIIQNINGF